MYKTKRSNSILIAILTICLVVMSIPWSGGVASAKTGGNTLKATMKYLVEDCGQRLQGTPNEAKAVEYIKSQYEEFGYKDVKLEKVPFKNSGTTGRLVLKDDSPDIIGNCIPNTDAFGETKGAMVDLGTDAAYAVPEDVEGDIVGMIKFAGNPGKDKIIEIINSVKSNDKVKLTGLIISKVDAFTFPYVPSTYEVPCFITAEYFYDKIRADVGNFAYMERYTQESTSVVTAIKPAKHNDPEAIIHITSHFDTVGTSRGANDNASGMATNIELANRFANVDMGNIGVRFIAVGAEENGMHGSIYASSNLTEVEKAISINMNMDSIASDQPTSEGKPLNAFSMDISPKPFAFNLPAYLVTDGAKDIGAWASGIENVRIYQFGQSDHEKYAQAGVDAASLITVNNDDNDLEGVNHTTKDNLVDNYSYERHVMATDLMTNALQKAKNQKLSKKAKFVSTDMGSYKRVTLENADRLFLTYSKITGTLTAADSGQTYKVSFTKDKPYVNGLPAYDSYAASDLTATGTGTSDNQDMDRNKLYNTFQTKLTSDPMNEKQMQRVKVETLRGGKVLGSGSYEEGTKVQIKAVPKAGYRFAGWYDKANNKKLSSAWKFSLTADKNINIEGKFAKIKKVAISAKALKGKMAKVSWKKNKGTYQYRIYRATSVKGKYKYIGKASSTSSTFINKKLKKNRTYYYKVRAVCKTDIYTFGEYSAGKKVKIRS